MPLPYLYQNIQGLWRLTSLRAFELFCWRAMPLCSSLVMSLAICLFVDQHNILYQYTNINTLNICCHFFSFVGSNDCTHHWQCSQLGSVSVSGHFIWIPHFCCHTWRLADDKSTCLFGHEKNWSYVTWQVICMGNIDCFLNKSYFLNATFWSKPYSIAARHLGSAIWTIILWSF